MPTAPLLSTATTRACDYCGVAVEAPTNVEPGDWRRFVCRHGTDPSGAAAALAHLGIEGDVDPVVLTALDKVRWRASVNPATSTPCPGVMDGQHHECLVASHAKDHGAEQPGVPRRPRRPEGHQGHPP